MTKQDFTELLSASNTLISEKSERDKSLEFIEKNEFPTKTDEIWRNIDLRPILNKNFTLSKNYKINSDLISEYKIKNLNADILVFADGKFNPELSEIQTENKNIFIGNLVEGKKRFSEIFKKYYEKSEIGTENIFSALNTAFSENGSFIYIADNQKPKNPIHILNFSIGNFSQIRNLFVLGKNSDVKIIHGFHSLSNDAGFTNSVTEIYIEENSLLNFNLFQGENDESFLLNNIHVVQSKNSRSLMNIATFAGSIVRNDVNIQLAGENSETEINGIYLPKKEQQFDNCIFIEHRKPHCTSRQLFKGIIDNNAKAVFRGRVLVDQNAQKTDASQSNKHLLITDSAKSYSRPQLEIYADDVKCSHGSSTGQIDKEALFYLRSRGISEKQAKILLMNAFAKEVIDKITIPEYKDYVENQI